MSPDTTTAIVTSLRGAEAAHAADIGPSSASAFVAFQGSPQLYASLLTCRNPAGSWSVASSGASGLAEVYRRAQVHLYLQEEDLHCFTSAIENMPGNCMHDWNKLTGSICFHDLEHVFSCSVQAVLMRRGAGAPSEAPSMAQEVLESALRGAVVVRLCRCLEDCAAVPNASGPSPCALFGLVAGLTIAVQMH